MKKILLSCACCLLAVGLLAGCDEEVEDVNPVDPNAGVVEPGDDDGDSTEPGGSGDEEGFLPVLGTVTAGDYFLGIEVDSVPYYFDGEVLQSYYGEVSEHGYEAVVVTVAEVTGGYTLSFVDSDETTQYIQMAESDTHRNFVWGDDPYVWSYDTTFKTFVALDSEGVYYYMGSYGTYKEMTLSQYNYLEEGASSYAQYPAHLYDVITYVAPTAITVTGEATVEVGRRISLTATVSGEDNVDPRYVWSWTSDNNGEVTISNTGVVLGVAEGSVTIIATSVADPSVYGYISIEVVTASTEVVTYKLGCLDSEEYTYWWFDGSSYGNFLTTSVDWEDGAEVYIDAVEGGAAKACTLSFYDDGSLKYISSDNSSTTVSISDDPCTWIWDDTNGVFAMGTTLNADSNNDRFLGLNDSNTIGGYAGSSSNFGTYLKITAFESSTMPTYPDRPTLESITISGPTFVEVGDTIHLTITETPKYAAVNVTWKSSSEEHATVDQDGYVEGIVATEEDIPVVITATSNDNSSIFDTYEITVKAAKEKVTETADFDALSSTKFNNGSYDVLVGTTYEGLTSCNIVWDDGTGGGTSNNTRVNSDGYIQWYSGEVITFAPKDGHELVKITITCTSGYAKDTSVTDELATATIEGDNIVITDFVDGAQSVTVKNASTAQARIKSITILYE